MIIYKFFEKNMTIPSAKLTPFDSDFISRASQVLARHEFFNLSWNIGTLLDSSRIKASQLNFTWRGVYMMVGERYHKSPFECHCVGSMSCIFFNVNKLVHCVEKWYYKLLNHVIFFVWSIPCLFVCVYLGWYVSTLGAHTTIKGI